MLPTVLQCWKAIIVISCFNVFWCNFFPLFAMHYKILCYFSMIDFISVTFYFTTSDTLTFKHYLDFMCSSMVCFFAKLYYLFYFLHKIWLYLHDIWPLEVRLHLPNASSNINKCFKQILVCFCTYDNTFLYNYFHLWRTYSCVVQFIIKLMVLTQVVP